MERNPISGVYKSEVADLIGGGNKDSHIRKKGLRRTEVVIPNGTPETGILMSIEHRKGKGKVPHFRFHGTVTLFQSPH